MLNLKPYLLLTLFLFTSSTMAGISSDHKPTMDLSADHNESNGVPMPFFANGRMQSRLNVTVSFTDEDGNDLSVSDDEVKSALSFYIKTTNDELTKDQDCSGTLNCWGFTFNENDYVHQMGTSYSYAQSLPTSHLSSNPQNLITAWIYGTEVAQFRAVCARITFDDNTTYDTCANPRDENAIYQAVQPVVYTANDFAELGEGEKVWEEEDYDEFYFEYAEVRNFYITPNDPSLKLVKVSIDNGHESNQDNEFLNDTWLGCYADCPEGFKSVKGFLFTPGQERTVTHDYVWNNAVQEGRTAEWRVNQKLRSVTLSKLLYSIQDISQNDTQSEYRFTAFDQYGNKAPLKLTYPESEFTNGGQEWDYTQWNLVSQ